MADGDGDGFFPAQAGEGQDDGEAIHDLQQAEQLTPELTHAHHGARLVTRDLLQLSGLRPRPELRDLAERFGVLP